MLVLIGDVYQALETVFHHFSKHLEVRRKQSATRRILNSLRLECGLTPHYATPNHDKQQLFILSTMNINKKRPHFRTVIKTKRQE